MIPKFRAWDKEKEKMLEVANISFDKEAYGYDLITIDKAKESPMLWTFNRLEEFVLMQYTGLKDKNGVEIYEGDICNVGVNMWGAIMTRSGEVIFNEDDIQYQIVIEDFLTITGKSEFETSEVIGNICENGDLLEVGGE